MRARDIVVAARPSAAATKAAAAWAKTPVQQTALPPVPARDVEFGWDRDTGALTVTVTEEVPPTRPGRRGHTERVTYQAPIPPVQIPASVHQGRAPNRLRITTALDLRGLDGPHVDHALGVLEPAVDEWETGVRIPTVEQVGRLVRLTGVPAEFLYRPDPPPTMGRGWMCGLDGCNPLGG